MRLFGIIFFLISMMGLDLHCQTELGLKFGLNLSNTDFGRNSEDGRFYTSKNLKAIHFGFTADIVLKNKFDLRTELFYIGKGFNGRPNFTHANLENVLALPALLKYNVLPRLSLLGGIEANYTISYYLIDGLEITNVKKRVYNIDTRRLNFGYTIGGEFKFAKRWSVDLRYVRIFSETAEDLNQIYNRTYMISFHRYFGKKSE